jgi:hypothetical protein
LIDVMEALERLSQRVPNVVLVCVGHSGPPSGLPVPWMHLGYVNNDRLLSNIYSAADLYVIPSFQDNLANTVLESLACGTPVVGFSTGGIPDMIQHGKTGLLVPRFDAFLWVPRWRTCSRTRNGGGPSARIAAAWPFTGTRLPAKLFGTTNCISRSWNKPSNPFTEVSYAAGSRLCGADIPISS